MAIIGPELEAAVGDIFQAQWEEIDSRNIPQPADLLLDSNQAKHLESATVLYADIDGSTSMVRNSHWQFAAEVYKAFLKCAATLIRDESGVVTAYDGDRVMGLFVGDSKNNDAVRCALRIRSAVQFVVHPILRRVYKNRPDYEVKYVVGVDTSEIRAARIGVRGGNDIVWIGRAPNYAAKLSDLSVGFSTIITDDVHRRLNPPLLLDLSGRNMWSPYTWNAMGGLRIFASNHYWTHL